LSVVFFLSEAARALAPSAPMPFPAACTAPNPHGKRHADKRRSHASDQRKETRSPPKPPPPSTEPRTVEVEHLERCVPLEQGRQSSRALSADFLPCGVQHPTKRQASQLKRTARPWQGARHRRRAKRMVPRLRLPAGPAPTRPPSSVGPERSSSVAPSRSACSHDEIFMSTLRGTLPSTAAASKAASSNLSPAAIRACRLSISSPRKVDAPAPMLADRREAFAEERARSVL